jgi:hypothetical protein
MIETVSLIQDRPHPFLKTGPAPSAAPRTTDAVPDEGEDNSLLARLLTFLCLTD